MVPLGIKTNEMETFILLARKAKESAKESGYHNKDRGRKFFLQGYICSGLEMCQEGTYLW